MIVGDDSPLYRDLLVHLLTGAGHDVVGEAGDLAGVVALADAVRPDLALLDIRMPPSYTDEGVRAALEIRQRHPHAGVVLLSQHAETAYAMRLAQALPDRAGYLLKERATGARELLDTLDRVAAGDLVVDPAIVSRLLACPLAGNPLHELTGRELQTLALMAEGLGNGAIARRMNVTQSTVEKHATALFRKLGLGLDSADVGGDNVRVRAVLTYLRHARS